MPELPEVETIARGLARRVTGDEIESVWLGSKPEPLKSSPQEIVSALENTRIEKVRRWGKHIVFNLQHRGSAPTDDPRQWVVHLGMTGRMLIADPETAIEKHTHAIAKLKSGRELRFVDPRRFGRLSVARARQGFRGTGAEPLEISFPAFRDLFRNRKTPIKSALLNQKLLQGIGNIYADESLFRAGIKPRRQAAKLTDVELKRLYDAIRQVLRHAIKLGGSSVSDYVDAEGEKGFFQLRHRVYLRTGQPCLTCKTPIKRFLLGGRGTHFCPKCQK